MDNGTEVRFARVGKKDHPVTIMMQAVPRKGDIVSWDYTNPSASSIAVGYYVVESVCWVMENAQHVIVLLARS